MAQPKVKKQGAQAAPILITTEPVQPNGVYLIRCDFSKDEMIKIKLGWDRMNKEAGINAMAIVLPKGTEIEELHTQHLLNLQKHLTALLQERGAYDLER